VARGTQIQISAFAAWTNLFVVPRLKRGTQHHDGLSPPPPLPLPRQDPLGQEARHRWGWDRLGITTSPVTMELFCSWIFENVVVRVFCFLIIKLAYDDNNGRSPSLSAAATDVFFYCGGGGGQAYHFSHLGLSWRFT
jgi:hypothetical protein